MIPVPPPQSIEQVVAHTAAEAAAKTAQLMMQQAPMM
jgi:hypothetical protein